MHGGDGHQSLLKVDHDERGLGVEGGECHRSLFPLAGGWLVGAGVGGGPDALGPRPARAWDMIVRSASTMTSPRALTTTMIKAITCRPWSLTLVWKTMEISAEEAIEPM